MDEQQPQQFQDLGAYGLPGKTGVVPPGHDNPYNVNQPPAGAIPAQEKPAGFFDSIPYHKYLADNKLTDASDKDLTGKHFDSYVDGPVKALVKAQLATQHGPGMSDKTLESHATAIAEGLKLQKRSEVEQNLGQLKAHLAGLKDKVPQDNSSMLDTILPQGTGAPLQPGETSLGRQLKHSAAGLGEGAINAFRSGNIEQAMNPAGAIADLVTGQRDAKAAARRADPLANKAYDYLSGVTKDTEAPANANIASRLGSVLGGLPEGVAHYATFGVLQSENEIAEKEKEAGKPLDAIEKALIYSKNATLDRLPAAAKGAVIKRMVTGSALSTGAQGVRNLLEGKPLTEGLAPAAALGAVVGPVFGHRPDAVAKPGDATPEVKPGGTPAPTGAAGTDADALAAQATAGKSQVAQVPLAPEHVDMLNEEASGDGAFQDVTTPEKAQQYVSQFADYFKVPPEQLSALTDAVNAHLKTIHGDEAPQATGVQTDDSASQVKPQPPQAPTEPTKAPTEPTKVPENQVSPDATNTTPPIEAPKPEAPKLPPSLRNVSPKYNLDKIGFDSDVDKALYIVGNPLTRSRAHNGYIDWLKNEVGLNGKQIVDMSARVKAAVKEASRNNRNPEGSATHFDLPEVEHPELAPKPTTSELSKSDKLVVPPEKSAAVEAPTLAEVTPEPPAAPVAPAAKPPAVVPTAPKPRVRYNPETGKVEPIQAAPEARTGLGKYRVRLKVPPPEKSSPVQVIPLPPKKGWLKGPKAKPR